jgi:hypothetical protein
MESDEWCMDCDAAKKKLILRALCGKTTCFTAKTQRTRRKLTVRDGQRVFPVPPLGARLERRVRIAPILPVVRLTSPNDDLGLIQSQGGSCRDFRPFGHVANLGPARLTHVRCCPGVSPPGSIPGTRSSSRGGTRCFVPLAAGVISTRARPVDADVCQWGEKNQRLHWP